MTTDRLRAVGTVASLREADAFDPLRLAAQEFRRRMAPLLALADLHPSASDLHLSERGGRMRVGGETIAFPYESIPGGGGMSFGQVRAALANAAVFGGVAFGPRPPAEPEMSVVVPPDLRVSAVMPPIAPWFFATVRFLRAHQLTLADYVRQGVMTEDQAAELRGLVRERTHNLLISGATGSGKTTLLKALLRERDPEERLLIIEDAAELAPEGNDVVPLRTTPSPPVTMGRLLKTVLRFAPDRIVVGEVRGPEALELIRAANTGHDGTLATVHSNGAEEALGRLHSLACEAQPGFPYRSVQNAIHVVVQIEVRNKVERRVSRIWHVPRVDYRVEDNRRTEP